MYGLYNLEARMNLREGPFLPADLKTVRHSLYDVRMVMSWMGWMEWPDALLSHLAHDGFDGIFASAYANPNGDRSTAESSTDFYARLMYRIRRQDPARVRDLVRRASRFGIKVYAPIIYQYQGTPESEADLRRLVGDLVKQFPDIRGYILLTEGFWYKKWGGGHGTGREYLEDWARNWSRAVGIVAEECHRVNGTIEILPWEYNIDFRPQKRRCEALLRPAASRRHDPAADLGKRQEFRDRRPAGAPARLLDQPGRAGGSHGGPDRGSSPPRHEGLLQRRYLRLRRPAPDRPYHPFPYQWYERYRAMEKHGISGTLESWSTGYTPSFQTELRAWSCWSDAPPLENLLGAMAARRFGSGGKEMVLAAWRLLSEGIRLVPDTGPTMGPATPSVTLCSSRSRRPALRRSTTPGLITRHGWATWAERSIPTGRSPSPVWFSTLTSPIVRTRPKTTREVFLGSSPRGKRESCRSF